MPRVFSGHFKDLGDGFHVLRILPTSTRALSGRLCLSIISGRLRSKQAMS
jgi:hypothetical protein